MSYNNYEEKDAQELLRKWRENNERNSEEVVELWLTHFKDNLNGLGAEKHVVLEQVIFAALDCHYYATANICIYLLSKEFPDSLRVMRLKAVMLEAEEKYGEALQILDEIIKIDETNAPARKRRVAILKARGLVNEAIKELVDYLKKFMSDVEAWQELCELYLHMHEYSKSAFCAEELILHQPHNHLLHQRLADIRYTMGGVENMELAKHYYCQTLKLNPDNMRALLGLFLATNNLLNHYRSSGNSAKRKELWKLCQWAQSQTTKKQNEARSSKGSLAQMMLSLSITD